MGVILPASQQKRPLMSQEHEQLNVFLTCTNFGLNDTVRVSNQPDGTKESYENPILSVI